MRAGVRRELVLLIVLIAIATGAFVLTRAAAAANQAMKLADAVAWYERGEADRRQGRLDAAVFSLRRAAALHPAEPRYRRALAGVLERTGERDDARQVLLAVQARSPEDADTTLQLARLEAGSGDLAAAVRHYSSALSTLWPAEQAEARRRVRTELIELLLRHDQRSRALSELLVLAANLPDHPAPQMEAGRMFLRAGDPRRAAEHFTEALRIAPRDPGALAGAGEAAFELGDYSRARRLLAAVSAQDGRMAQLRTIADLVLTSDPLAPRIALAERRRRLVAAFDRTARRLDECEASLRADGVEIESIRDEAERFRASIDQRRSLSSRDAIEDGFDVVIRIAKSLMEARCAPPTPLDRALRLIAERHGLS
jgi:tetratricopeptide (TPR) repeat protein